MTFDDNEQILSDRTDKWKSTDFEKEPRWFVAMVLVMQLGAIVCAGLIVINTFGK